MTDLEKKKQEAWDLCQKESFRIEPWTGFVPDECSFNLGFDAGIKAERERVTKAIKDSEYRYSDDYLGMLFPEENKDEN